jgi:hypothetical protein
MVKESLMGRTNHHSLPTSTRRPIRGKEHAITTAEWLIAAITLVTGKIGPVTGNIY